MTTPPRCLSAFIVTLLLTGTALAQTSAQKPAAAKTKPAAKPKTGTTKAAKPGSANSDYWSLDYATPDRYGRAVTGRTTTELSGETGRVPLQAGPGTVGFDTVSRVNRNVPGGADPYAQKDASFVGMSINVPSLSKNLELPVLPTPFGRPE